MLPHGECWVGWKMMMMIYNNHNKVDKHHSRLSLAKTGVFLVGRCSSFFPGPKGPAGPPRQSRSTSGTTLLISECFCRASSWYNDPFPLHMARREGHTC